MLKEIYELGKSIKDENNRFEPREILGYIILNESGNLIDNKYFFEEVKKKDKIIVPKFQQRLTASNVAQLLVEKVAVIFDSSNKKYNCYKSYMEDIKDLSLELKAIYTFLYEIYPLNKLEYDNLFKKYFTIDSKKTPFISFRVNDKYIEDTTEWRDYFDKKYIDYEDKLNTEMDSKVYSCITNKLINPISVSDQVRINGVTSSTGDSIVCFDKDAFQSYGLKNALNAPMSIEESKQLKKGFEKILSKPNYSSRFKMSHWYSGEVPTDEDIINIATGDFDDFSFFLDFQKKTDKKDKEFDDKKDKSINDFLETFCTKDFKDINSSSDILDLNFYTLRYVPCTGRMSLSGFKKGSIRDIYVNVQTFYEDSSLIGFNGNIYRLSNYWRLYYHLLRNKNATDKNKQIDSELGRNFDNFFYAILYNNQLPRDYFIRAIENIEKTMIRGEKPSITLYQFLKIYLKREERKKGENFLMSELNENYNNPAYLCGRLLRVYEYIQLKSNNFNSLNVDVTKRYFSACSKTPARILSIINDLGIYHLSKYNSYYDKKLLDDIYSKFEGPIPEKLDKNERALFMMGYYQQGQAIFNTSKKTEESEDTVEETKENNNLDKGEN